MIRNSNLRMKDNSAAKGIAEVLMPTSDRRTSSAWAPPLTQVLLGAAQERGPTARRATPPLLAARSRTRTITTVHIRTTQPAFPAPPPESPAPVPPAPAVRPSLAAAPTRGSSAAGRRHATRTSRRDCQGRRGYPAPCRHGGWTSRVGLCILVAPAQSISRGSDAGDQAELRVLR
jgi:hypothetical protein